MPPFGLLPLLVHIVPSPTYRIRHHGLDPSKPKRDLLCRGGKRRGRQRTPGRHRPQKRLDLPISGTKDLYNPFLNPIMGFRPLLERPGKRKIGSFSMPPHVLRGLENLFLNAYVRSGNFSIRLLRITFAEGSMVMSYRKTSDMDIDFLK